jgi:hypothetical protein
MLVSGTALLTSEGAWRPGPRVDVFLVDGGRGRRRARGLWLVYDAPREDFRFVVAHFVRPAGGAWRPRAPNAGLEFELADRAEPGGHVSLSDAVQRQLGPDGVRAFERMWEAARRKAGRGAVSGAAGTPSRPSPSAARTPRPGSCTSRSASSGS